MKPGRPCGRSLRWPQHSGANGGTHGREFAYTAGAEQALELAGVAGWTVVSSKDDGATFLGPATSARAGDPA